MVSKTESRNVILIGRCDCDPDVSFPYYWCEEVIREAEAKGDTLIDLKQENFNRNKFESTMKILNPNLIFLNGHGTPYSAMGFNKTDVLIANCNDYLMKNKITHIISCETGIILGNSLMQKGCKGYIGYKGIFKYWKIDKNPSKCVISKMFMEAVNKTSLSLLNGKSVKEAYEYSQEIYNKHIGDCAKIFYGKEESPIKRYVSDILMALVSNKNNQLFFSI